MPRVVNLATCKHCGRQWMAGDGPTPTTCGPCSRRVVLWSCGGGRQSAGIAALIVQGRLPPPDHVAMVAIEWEFRKVWPYVNRYVRPALERLGIPFTAIPRKQYATVDFWSGEDGDSVTIPAYSNQSGAQSKLPEYCSNEWKQRVVMRWASEQAGWKGRGVNCWVGISLDEKRRRRAPSHKWFQPIYPLLDILPSHTSGCYQAVEQVGWPEPPRSRCSHCPNQGDAEWAELSPEEWEAACKLDEEIRQTDPHAYLHRSLIPLRQVTLKPEAGGLFTGGCSSGMCY